MDRQKQPPRPTSSAGSEMQAEDLLLLTVKEIEILEEEAVAVNVPVHSLTWMITFLGISDSTPKPGPEARLSHRLALMEAKVLKMLDREDEEPNPDFDTLMENLLGTVRRLRRALEEQAAGKRSGS